MPTVQTAYPTGLCCLRRQSPQTAIGLGTTFYNPNWRVVCYTFLGTVFTVVAQGALNVLLNVYGIPTLTFPFVVAAWIFLLPNIDLLPKNYQS